MRHLDLFSGIGGFALAAGWVWGNSHKIVAFCEIDKFCQKVLKKHWPAVPICEDIRNLTNEKIIANATGKRLCRRCENRTEQQSSMPGQDTAEDEQIDLLTGGFPCQPFSCAGKRRGKDDDRALWPEMLRVIKAVKPQWVIGENVAGFVNMALEECCLDLEMEGYEVQPYIIPACAVNAPHRRDRVWIIAHNGNGDSRQGRLAGEKYSGGFEDGKKTKTSSIACGQNSGGSDVADTADTGDESLRRERKDPVFQDACDSIRNGLSRNARRGSGQEFEDGFAQDANRKWSRPWLEVAAELCGVDDGLPAELDGLKLSKSKHRENRLKSLGNAIVPQVAMVIMQAIKETTDFADFQWMMDD